MDAPPLHLAGNNAPVSEEHTIGPDAITVVGTLPDFLEGTFVRNGPNPRSGWSPHLFDGDGMVHAVTIDGGAVREYRNRYVRTPLYERPGTARTLDYTVSTANTHVVEHAGRLLALEEGGFPYELTRNLTTVGPYTFGGALRTPMTAHPKTCTLTGDLLFFAYELRPPHVTLHRADRDGTLRWTTTIDVPQPTLMHDFAITATRVIVFDSPLVFDPRAIRMTGSPWRWDDAHGARFGVLDRDASGSAIRWFDVETSHLSHAANAHDDGGHVVVTGTRIVGGGLPRLHEWRIDVGTGVVTERSLDDVDAEYPRLAADRVGLANRYTYTSSFVMEAEPHHSEIYKYDHVADARTVHRLPDGQTCGEPVFVRRGDRAEDDGVLLTFAHDRSTTSSHLLVLDATDVTAPPLAEVRLPVRVPAGFHGSWLPG